jgi:hypothetical protein
MICSDCVNTESLTKFIKVKGFRVKCYFCHTIGICVHDAVLSDFMADAVQKAVVSTDCLTSYEQAMVFECGSDTPDTFALCDYLDGYACDEFIESFAQDLPFDEGGLYALNDGTLDELNDFGSRWTSYMSSIESQHRFFNSTAKQFLDELFEVLLISDDIDPSLVHSVGYDIPIYRARIAADKETIKKIQSSPMSELGPPPSALASNQRMSPEGISVFYGALNIDVCISEIRPLVGDAVLSGEFRALSQLKLLNLNKLESFNAGIDIFDDGFIKYSHAVSFFKELVFQMSRPAHRGSGNPYLSTQVIFEYLSLKLGGQVDGIMYRSVQQDQAGECIALFPRANTVSESGACELVDSDDPFYEKDENVLFFVPSSIKYHRVRGVSYQQKEYTDDLVFTAGKRVLELIGERN